MKVKKNEATYACVCMCGEEGSSGQCHVHGSPVDRKHVLLDGQHRNRERRGAAKGAARHVQTARGGVVCKDGIILGTEKLVLNKMMIAGTDKRLYSVNMHTGGVINGLSPDGRAVVQRGREESTQYESMFGIRIPGAVLADRLALQF